MSVHFCKTGRWLMFVLILITGSIAAFAQDAPACPADMTCVKLVFASPTMTGEFYVAGVLVAAGQNRVTLTIPPDTRQVVVRNIQDPVPGFNELFVL